MGFDITTFHKILDHGFRDLWNTLAIPRCETNIDSRPRLGCRSLDAEGALGLILHWLSSTMLDENNSLIMGHHPLLNGAFSSMDGLNLAVQTLPDQEIENAMFNGWLHDHFVSSMFAFSMKGEIIACNLNAPGSWHNSCVVRSIYEKL
ncbi:uncharacterized protein LACBIDRAFT_329150 [Laccaria bicolor S238N-H82]|uniref:Predicted protein n=1 Tax=Laccaria bicolor (strain S238N-H82 / ATCC MYA-4686) TaxID=486041 RepID=B0DH79_LACBS|nr:uncharacterized protein LACBIDRAFT_329150 [Laccaria bicolor S238N-H82]EDR05968.1 predicted protein [Laccaria bicolor S238N-H82]|eukprot:XP_001883256.1 predicted protein [Laccaria bicolor S238N-H82]